MKRNYRTKAWLSVTRIGSFNSSGSTVAYHADEVEPAPQYDLPTNATSSLVALEARIPIRFIIFATHSPFCKARKPKLFPSTANESAVMIDPSLIAVRSPSLSFSSPM
jgi:hypothetical protein